MKRPYVKKFSIIVSLLMFVQLTIAPSLIAVAQKESELSKNAASNGEGYNIIEEVIDKRDEYTKHFICDDGSYIAVSYSDKVHYLDNKNRWIEIDNTLKEITRSNGTIVTELLNVQKTA